MTNPTEQQQQEIDSAKYHDGWTDVQDEWTDARSQLCDVLDKGLVTGLGSPEPGKFCGEAAVCYVLGEPHSDRPSCVHEVDRSVVIKINDYYPGTEQERAIALRPVLLAHLGTAGKDRGAWMSVVARGTIQTILPIALNAAADLHSDAAHKTKLREVSQQCSEQGTLEASHAARAASASASASAYAAHAAAYSAYAAAYAAYANARKNVWDKFIDVVMRAYEETK